MWDISQLSDVWFTNHTQPKLMIQANSQRTGEEKHTLRELFHHSGKYYSWFSLGAGFDS